MIKQILVAFVLMTSAISMQAQAFQTIVLVRHGEKIDDSRDPLLSEKGQQRAQNLARILRDANIEQVFATEYQRTQLTAKPLAESRQLVTATYAAKESLTLGQQLRATTKNTLVVGHSNTLNTLLQGLGINEQKAVAEDEFDRLLIVHLHKDGMPSLTVLRY